MAAETFDYKKLTEEDLFEVRKCKIKILMLQEKNKELCQANNEEINRLDKIIINKTIHAKAALTEFKKETGEKKIDISQGGWTHFKTMPDKWNYDTSKLIRWAKEDDERRERYIKVTEEFKKAQLKKDYADGIITHDDVCDEGLTITSQDPKFEYKLPGGGDLL